MHARHVAVEGNKSNEWRSDGASVFTASCERDTYVVLAAMQEGSIRPDGCFAM